MINKIIQLNNNEIFMSNKNDSSSNHDEINN